MITPNLPPMPEFILKMTNGVGQYMVQKAIRDYALAAYQSARDLALEDAAEACEARIGTHSEGLKPEDVKDCDEEARECAAAIRALKSDTREKS